MGRWWALMLGLACFGVAAARAEVLNDTANGPHPVLELPETLTLGDIIVERHDIASKPPGQSVTVARGRQRLVALQDQHFELNYQHADSGPELIVTGWSGGAHCCYTLHVLSLVPPLQHQAIPVDDNDQVGFIDQDNAPPLLQFGDFTFAYWHAAFVDSPAPRLILRYDPGSRRYRADFAAMHKDPPDTAALKALVAKPQAPLWGPMLDLIYSGNAPAARQLLDLAWPEGRPGKERFLACFTSQLRSGKLWQMFGLGTGFAAEADFPPKPVTEKACQGDW
jgi:hypothetical protein